jgi:hypothetical protein
MISHARDVPRPFPQGCTLGSLAAQNVEISLGLSRSTSIEVTLTDHGFLEGFIEIMVFIPSHLFSSAQLSKITSRMSKAEPEVQK